MKIKKIILSMLSVHILLFATPSNLDFQKKMAEEVSKLYIGVLGRAPDGPGLEYWINAGLTLAQIAKSFFEQKETQEKYPNLSHQYQTFINNMYIDLFGREADKAGLEYWFNDLKKGIFGPDKLVLALINGAKEIDKIRLENRTKVALAYAETKDTDVKKAKEIIQKVNENPESVEQAIQVIKEEITSDSSDSSSSDSSSSDSSSSHSS